MQDSHVIFVQLCLVHIHAQINNLKLCWLEANLAVVEVLSDVLENYYENLTSRLKAVVEKEVAGVSHGFLVIPIP